MDAASGLRLLTRRQVKQFARNWREWCSGRPPRAVELPNWPEVSAWVGQVPTPLWEFFPRRDQALRLSDFDRVILEHIGPDWSTPLAMYLRMLRGEQARQGVWGDLTITARMAAWGSWEKGRFVERRRAAGKAPMTRWEYRVTSEGLALQHQMTRLQDAPPFRLGGFSFYSPRSWVMSDGSPVRTRLR